MGIIKQLEPITVNSTPTYLVLDANKKIIAKPDCNKRRHRIFCSIIMLPSLCNVLFLFLHKA